MLTKYFTCNTKQKTDREASQDNESAREELAAWKVKINWNNCLLQWWICYRYYGYSLQNYFAGSTIASLNQSLHFRLMRNHNILDVQRICALQVREIWGNSPFADPNMKAWLGHIFWKFKNKTFFKIIWLDYEPHRKNQYKKGMQMNTT